MAGDYDYVEDDVAVVNLPNIKYSDPNQLDCSPCITIEPSDAICTPVFALVTAFDGGNCCLYNSA